MRFDLLVRFIASPPSIICVVMVVILPTCRLIHIRNLHQSILFTLCFARFRQTIGLRILPQGLTLELYAPMCQPLEVAFGAD